MAKVKACASVFMLHWEACILLAEAPWTLSLPLATLAEIAVLEGPADKELRVVPGI